MSTESRHTPTPWKITSPNYPQHQRVIFHREGDRHEKVATLNEGSISADANAEFIIRAVNNHEALVEALSGILARMEDENYDEPHYEAVNAFIEQARTAINNATKP